MEVYIPGFIKIRSEVFEPQRVQICAFPLLFTTACTAVQAVISKIFVKLLVEKYLTKIIYMLLTSLGPTLSARPFSLRLVRPLHPQPRRMGVNATGTLGVAGRAPKTRESRRRRRRGRWCPFPENL